MINKKKAGGERGVNPDPRSPPPPPSPSPSPPPLHTPPPPPSAKPATLTCPVVALHQSTHLLMASICNGVSLWSSSRSTLGLPRPCTEFSGTSIWTVPSLSSVVEVHRLLSVVAATPVVLEICLYSRFFHAYHPELDILSAELEGAAEENNGVEHNNKKYLASYEVTNHTSRATKKCDPALSSALKFEFCSGVCALSFCWGRLLANWTLL